jgi:nucleoside-diphosphate-sugar epimerase
MKALVIGGTGPTGPHLIQGLLDRGYETTVLHRGVHEPADLPDVPHIHADPHFAETLIEGVGDGHWDVVLATYGRLKIVSEVLSTRCDHFVGVSGVPVYRGMVEPDKNRPYGMQVLAREDGPKADELAEPSRFGSMILNAERSVFAAGERAGIATSTVRYPQIYGPRNIVPWEWAVIRRVADGRRQMILPDDGLWIISRCAAENAAAVVLAIVERREIAAGQAYNCADDVQYTLRQWAEIVNDLVGGELEFVGIPSLLAPSAMAEWLAPGCRPHTIVSTEKARAELGYRDAVAPMDALRETVEWLQRNPVTAADYPMYPAKFDYELEDTLIASWASAVERVQLEAPDQPPALAHPMPHPKAPSLTADERGR